MPYPRMLRSRSHKIRTRDTGNITVNTIYTAAGMQTVDGNLDIALEAQAGDVIEYGLNVLVENQAVDLMLDVAVMTGTTQASRFGRLYGVLGWYAINTVYHRIGSVFWKELAAGDIVNNTVTLRLIAGTSTGAARVLRAIADEPLTVFARNLGPVDPN